MEENCYHVREWVSSVLRPRQHSIGYMGDGFYRSKDATNSIKGLKEMLQKRKKTTVITKVKYITQQLSSTKDIINRLQLGLTFRSTTHYWSFWRRSSQPIFQPVWITQPSWPITWLILTKTDTEQCLTSPPTQYRLYGWRFLQVKRLNQQYHSTEGTHTLHK